MISKPNVGISACLLGERVRFDGEHKRDDWLEKELGKWVNWRPVCPEMEMGLGTPRESLRLVQTASNLSPSLITNQTNADLTVNAHRTASQILRRLPVLDGFVLKKNSPSCGKERVRVYNGKGIPSRTGTGIFAAQLLKAHPLLPCIEEGRLTDAEQREHFIIRIFALHRLRNTPIKVGAIQKFHESYKLLLMAHSQINYRRLGQLAANSSKRNPKEVWEAYAILFQETLSLPSSTKKRVNVLQHAFGYMKKQLSKKERDSLLGALEAYRLGDLSFLAVLTLLQHEMKKLSPPYLQSQLFFQPYPKALKLRRFL